jgi:hypothetical protein
MNARLDSPPSRTDPALQVLLATALLAVAVGALLLLRAASASSPGHVTLQADNQTALPLTLTALDPSGRRVTVGSAGPRAVTTIQEVVDIGGRWTLVADYAGREVQRQTLTRAELRARRWTVVIPASATRRLEQAGFR